MTVPKLKELFVIKESKTSLEKNVLKSKFPEFSKNIIKDFPKFFNDEFGEVEAYDLGHGRAVARWGHEDGEEGFPVVWDGKKYWNLYDIVDSNFTPYPDMIDAAVLAVEAFGHNGFWTKIASNAELKRAKERMRKIDQRISSYSGKSGKNFWQHIGDDDEDQSTFFSQVPSTIKN